MSWLTLIKYGIPAAALAVTLWAIDNRAYNSGVEAANKVCTETTVPAAQKAIQDKCDANDAITKETCDALQTRFDDIDGRYKRLRKSTASAKCLPVTSASKGSDGNAEAYVPAVQLGISTEWLAGAFYDTDRYAAVGMTAQETLCGIYRVNDQLDKLPPGSCPAK